MNRRACLSMIAAASALWATRGAAQTGDAVRTLAHRDHPLQQAWAAWKALCLTPDGRIVDGFQSGASHSEGQGYGLVLAALFGDLASCQSIVTWTERHLAIRDDALLAWRWRQETSPQVPDRNNASDGDLFYAWGLMLAADQGADAGLRTRAMAITQDLDRLCLADHPDGGGGVIFLPAATGFVRDAGVVVNPSYYMPLAMSRLAEAAGTPRLAQAARDGIALIDRLGAAGPVPDWVLIDAAGVQPAPPEFSPLSGYEAVRVPLFALWSGQAQSPAVRAYIQTTSGGDGQGTPTRIDPRTGEVSERSAHPGYRAVARLADCAAGGGVGSLMPRFDANQPYYPASLHLMSLVVQVTTYPRCVPL
ncbi:glycosyl hydrolase family 8 [Paracoccus nototheniae]|uniref:cellulase n=1 Tax=Paracoccus nototheniae TaxID=2489002 RepID=A0ABW4E1C8_9RHOB|nr:glycosyl hydrolase family 8 [Paracoccus nototheniae]